MELSTTTEYLLKTLLAFRTRLIPLDLCWLMTHTVRHLLKRSAAGAGHTAQNNIKAHAESVPRLMSLSPPVGPAFDLSAFKDGLEVIVPQPLVIRVPISGYPTPVAKWTFGEKELTTADERVSLMTKSTFTELSITPSVRPDKGIYTLQLENDVTTVSGEIEVNVIGTPERNDTPRPKFCSLFLRWYQCFWLRLQRRPALQRTLRSWR